MGSSRPTPILDLDIQRHLTHFRYDRQNLLNGMIYLKNSSEMLRVLSLCRSIKCVVYMEILPKTDVLALLARVLFQDKDEEMSEYSRD